jgi:twitching motility protein PilT
LTDPESLFLPHLRKARLRDLAFVDLYIALHADLPSYYQIAEAGDFNVMPKLLPADYHLDVAALRRELETALHNVDEASLNHDGVRLRVCKILTTRGETWAAMRRVTDRPPSLDKLGLKVPDVQLLRGLGLRDGLILICGGTAQGKTTTACSLLYDYLVRYGGMAFTIEDPVEYVIDGWQGYSGLCYQVEVKAEEDWAKFLKLALRWHPRYIMVGELRTPEAANQLLRAANSGHLVITTMHGGTVEEGLEGLVHLARQAIGEQAPTLLASGLAAVLHQNFMTRSVATRLYVTEQGNLGDPVRALIREGHIGQAVTFVDLQERSGRTSLDTFCGKRPIIFGG